MSSFTFTIEVQVERDSGKFAGRDEIAEQLMEALESADPGTVDGIGADGDSSYSVVDWSVSEDEPVKATKRAPSGPPKAGSAQRDTDGAALAVGQRVVRVTVDGGAPQWAHIGSVVGFGATRVKVNWSEAPGHYAGMAKQYHSTAGSNLRILKEATS
jgi:hypothetical protein